jgi:hypothetical protein
VIEVGPISERGRVIYAFLCGRLAVTVKQWVQHAEDGDEHGARVEIQRLEQRPIGSEFAAVPLSFTDPVWRADLFTFEPGEPGNHDRAHFHPTFDGYEPSDRSWDVDLQSDPIGWLQTQLGDKFADVLAVGGAADLAGGPETADVRSALPHIVEAARRCLA